MPSRSPWPVSTSVVSFFISQAAFSTTKYNSTRYYRDKEMIDARHKQSCSLSSTKSLKYLGILQTSASKCQNMHLPRRRHHRSSLQSNTPNTHLEYAPRPNTKGIYQPARANKLDGSLISLHTPALIRLESLMCRKSYPVRKSQGIIFTEGRRFAMAHLQVNGIGNHITTDGKNECFLPSRLADTVSFPLYEIRDQRSAPRRFRHQASNLVASFPLSQPT
jgi:hypothetical protein